MNAALALSVAGVSVSQDAFGRFSLTDLHRASGSRAKHKPYLWLRSDQTKNLIAELESEAKTEPKGTETCLWEGSTAQPPAVGTSSGNAGGTFVVRELVYAYAMWISAAFHLKVIRAYDKLVSGAAAIGLAPSPAPNPRPAPLLACVRERRALTRLLAETTDRIAARGYYRCLQLVDRELGIETESLEDLAPCARQSGLPGV